MGYSTQAVGGFSACVEVKPAAVHATQDTSSLNESPNQGAYSQPSIHPIPHTQTHTSKHTKHNLQSAATKSRKLHKLFTLYFVFLCVDFTIYTIYIIYLFQSSICMVGGIFTRWFGPSVIRPKQLV